MTVRTERYAGNDRRVVELWIDRLALLVGRRHRRHRVGAAPARGSATTNDEGVRGALWGHGLRAA